MYFPLCFLWINEITEVIKLQMLAFKIKKKANWILQFYFSCDGTATKWQQTPQNSTWFCLPILYSIYEEISEHKDSDE